MGGSIGSAKLKKMRMTLKMVWAVIGLLVPILVHAQGAANASNEAIRRIVTQVRPDVMVVIRVDQTNSCLVEVSALDPEYPPDLLTKQCQRLGLLAGSPVRGLALLQTDPDNQALNILKAKFATDNLVNRSTGGFALQPIIRAFAGETGRFVTRGMTIHFAGETPTNSTIRTHLSDAVAVYGEVQANPDGIEYRVRLLSQDADKILVPSEFKPSPKPQQKTVVDQGVPKFVWVLLTLASLAAGALVYCFVVGVGWTRGRTRTQ
jgi:hypothetical protein